MALKKDRFFWTVIGAVSFALALITYVEIHSIDLQYEGTSLRVLRSFELHHIQLEGEISDSRTFTVEDYKRMAELTELSHQDCAELIHFNDRYSDSDSKTRKQATIALCENYADRLKVIHDFRETNFKLRSALDEADELTLQLAKFKPAGKAMTLFNQFLADEYPWTTHAEELSLALQNLETSLPRKSSATVSVKEAIADAQLIVHSINTRLKMEKTITDVKFDEMFENLRLNYLNSYSKHTERAAKVRFIQSILSATLIALMGFVLIKLKKASRSVQNLNQTLEEKVALRTKELQEVLSQLEEQQQILTQSAKMSALGEMAGGIAHEINTPLAAISLHAELLTLDAIDQNQPQLVEGLSSITKIVEKISKIVIGLKRFSRTGESGVKSLVSFDHLLEDTLLLCSEKLKVRGIDLRIENAAADEMIDCAPEQISQILLNLMNNAVDALEHAPTKQIQLSSYVFNNQLVVRVADSGPGIPLELRDKLMQPFFTTKAIGKGTGLGLSISKGIANSHGGTLILDAYSKQTCFILTLPLANAAEHATPQAA